MRGSMAAKMEALHGLLRLYGIRMDYADDLGNAEADYELQEAIDRSSERCSGISICSRVKADQNMAQSKCLTMPLQRAAAVGETSAADVTALNLEHQCECGEPFGSWWGLRQHRRCCGAALVWAVSRAPRAAP